MTHEPKQCLCTYSRYRNATGALEYLYTSNGQDQLYCHSCGLAVSRPAPRSELLTPQLKLEERYGE